MAESKYCSNCDNEAVYKIPQSGQLLCETCGTAYTWGQNCIANDHIPENRVLDLLDDDEETEDGEI